MDISVFIILSSRYVEHFVNTVILYPGIMDRSVIIQLFVIINSIMLVAISVEHYTDMISVRLVVSVIIKLHCQTG